MLEKIVQNKTISSWTVLDFGKYGACITKANGIRNAQIAERLEKFDASQLKLMYKSVDCSSNHECPKVSTWTSYLLMDLTRRASWAVPGRFVSTNLSI